MAIHLYRIAQEALNNAIKHGQPRRVVIECSTNLSHWSPVLTNSGPVNPFEFSLPFATNNGALFYRAVARP